MFPVVVIVHILSNIDSYVYELRTPSHGCRDHDPYIFFFAFHFTEGEVASFVGQPQPPTLSSFAPEFNPTSASVPHPDPQQLQHQNAPATSEIYLSPVNETSRDNISESYNQPQKQGYLSSLLSSLPNLSLSSITGDRDEAGQKSFTDQATTSNEYNYPSQYHQQYNLTGIGQDNVYGSVPNAAAAALTTPPVQPPPPALPPTGQS